MYNWGSFGDIRFWWRPLTSDFHGSTCAVVPYSNTTCTYITQSIPHVSQSARLAFGLLRQLPAFFPERGSEADTQTSSFCANIEAEALLNTPAWNPLFSSVSGVNTSDVSLPNKGGGGGRAGGGVSKPGVKMVVIPEPCFKN